MLSRSHVAPFTTERAGRVDIDYLEDADGRVVAFLDRLCRLLRRLEGRPRATAAEALRRQERRVRDARRMGGIARALLDASRFEPPSFAARAEAVREAVFAARGRRWPPTPGDGNEPYRAAAAASGLTIGEAREALYADRPDRRVLVRAPRWDGRRLLDRYNLELARALLLDAVEVTLTARGGWRDVFRAVKRERLMHRIERLSARRFRLTLTGPAAPWVTRARRYGIRFARVLPALARAPGWRLEAMLERDGARAAFTLEPGGAIRTRAQRARFDSAWERQLAADFAALLPGERDGWSLAREDTPVVRGEFVMLPDFTLRHRDGRQALVEVVGFWTSEYLDRKLEQVTRAGLDNLILVVYRDLAAGARTSAVEDAWSGPVVWFAKKPRIRPILEAAERVGQVGQVGQ